MMTEIINPNIRIDIADRNGLATPGHLFEYRWHWNCAAGLELHIRGRSGKERLAATVFQKDARWWARSSGGKTFHICVTIDLGRAMGAALAFPFEG